MTFNLLDVFIKKVRFKALVDTGASISIIREDVRKMFRLVCTPWNGGTLRSANATLLNPLGIVSVELTIQNEPHRHCFVILPNCTHDIILGWDFLATRRALIDCATKSIYFSDPIPYFGHFLVPTLIFVQRLILVFHH